MNAKRLCPFCAGETFLKVSVCPNCGRNMQTMKLAHSQAQAKIALYQVVPDGLQFGILIAGDLKLHGLAFDKAQDLAAFLNSVTESSKAR
jgi:hypothetical protein